jgi:hypothetical protein
MMSACPAWTFAVEVDADDNVEPADWPPAERPVAVPRDPQLDLADLGRHGLRVGAVSTVARASAGRVIGFIGQIALAARCTPSPHRRHPPRRRRGQRHRDPGAPRPRAPEHLAGVHRRHRQSDPPGGPGQPDLPDPRADHAGAEAEQPGLLTAGRSVCPLIDRKPRRQLRSKTSAPNSLKSPADHGLTWGSRALQERRPWPAGSHRVRRGSGRYPAGRRLLVPRLPRYAAPKDAVAQGETGGSKRAAGTAIRRRGRSALEHRTA